MKGHRVATEIELYPTDAGGLKERIKAGNRSLLVVFHLEDDEFAFGAVVESVAGTGAPGTSFNAQLWFWNDRAAVYAAPGRHFELQYGRTVGNGKVLAVGPGL